MSIAANRFPHVRAALVDNADNARLSRLHNNANVLCLGSKDIDAEAAPRILDAFLSTSFEGGRHERRVEKLDHIGGAASSTASLAEADPEIFTAIQAEALRQFENIERRVPALRTNTPRDTLGSAGTGVAKTWMLSSSSPLIGRKSSLALSTRMCSRILDRRQTWQCTSQCSKPETASSRWIFPTGDISRTGTKQIFQGGYSILFITECRNRTSALITTPSQK
jgi:hypothetical protein